MRPSIRSLSRRSYGALPLATLLVAACSSSSGAPAATHSGDAATDAASDAPVDKSKTCVATFGQGIDTVGFARFDGTVVAVVPPNDQACAEPNSTHLVLEMSFAGAVYRMVIDVDDEVAPGTIHGTTMTHALVGGAWSDGWHAVTVDYVSTFGLHSSSFPVMTTDAAVAEITSALALGARVSVYATAEGEPDSAHLVHRNLADQDGAIVIDVDEASPKWLLFSFSDQTF